MGFHTGPRAPFFIILSLSCFISHCYNSKITFPNGENNNIDSPTDSTLKIVNETLIPSPTSESQSSLSDSLGSSFFDFFASADKSKVNDQKSGAFSFPENNELAEVKGFVRSLEITDSGEVYNPDRRLKYEDDRRRGGRRDWDFEDKDSRWSPPPNEKTIAMQVLDEDPYHHGRPAWPHDEYLVGYFDVNTPPVRSNGNESDATENFENSNITPEEISKFYEWKRLQARPSPSAFIGPGFYDVGSLTSPSSSSGDYYRYHQPAFQAITTDGTGKIQNTSPSGSSNGGTSGEAVPGTPSESNTNTRHFPPYLAYGNDFYKRKRLRLQIHPGLIAAPLAGLAAFGAASALTSKPLLVELGYIRNKPNFIGGGGGVPGGWGWAGTPGSGYRPYPPFYPPPNPPPIYPPIGVGTGSIGHHHGPIGNGLGLGIGGGIAHGGASHSPGGGSPIYPILKPIRHKPESERSTWWNPFSSLTPRLVIE